MTREPNLARKGGQTALPPNVKGSPGTGARMWGVWHAAGPALVILVIMGFVLGAALRPALLTGVTAAWILLILSGAMAWALWRGNRRFVNHIQGAAGEEQVARRLDRLPEDWMVVHSFPLGKGWRGGGHDVDHLVLGPAGLFLVETKNWSGEIAIRGESISANGVEILPDAINRTRKQALDVSDWVRDTSELRVPVFPVMVFVNAHLAGGMREVNDVWICEESDLLTVLQNNGAEPVGDAVIQRVADQLTRVMKRETGAES